MFISNDKEMNMKKSKREKKEVTINKEVQPIQSNEQNWQAKPCSFHASMNSSPCIL